MVLLFGLCMAGGWTTASAADEKAVKFELENLVTLRVGESMELEFDVINGQPANLRPATTEESPSSHHVSVFFGRRMRDVNRFNQKLPDVDFVLVQVSKGWSVTARCEYWPTGILRPRVLASVRGNRDFPGSVDRICCTAITLRSEVQ